MSLVENFKDRVPTQVLANGAIRYAQYDAQGNLIGYTYFKRADEPTEVGNIWNKLIYDGIKEAIETLDTNKLNISSKATASEATTGTNDTKYMTPSKTKSAIDNYKATQAQAEAGSDNTKYMTALRVLQEINAKALPSKQMSIKEGTITNNGTIPQTSGYSNYLYFVSPNDVFGTASTGGSFSSVGFGVECEVNQSTRKVTCRMATQSTGSSTSYTGGTANYLEIAWN